MNCERTVALMTVILAATTSTAWGQADVWSDNFDDNNPIGWGSEGFPVGFTEINQQLSLTGSFTGPVSPNNLLTHHVPAYHPITISGPLPDQQTLEFRVDLVRANQNDAWAGLHAGWTGQGGYLIYMDQDEVLLCKYYGSPLQLASFVYETPSLKSQNVTLVLGLTRDGSNLNTTARVLDKDKAYAVLFERTATDTPESDPVVPSGTVRGTPGAADPAGTPWPLVTAPDKVGLTMQWMSSDHGPDPLAQVIFDNLEIRQYETPQLTIQSAVVLSWPLTVGQFVLESATNVNGPWAPVPDPWWRTNNAQNEVSIRAPDSLRFFRLRLVP